MGKTHKLGEIPSYLKSKCNSKLKIKGDNEESHLKTEKDRPATCPKIESGNEESHLDTKKDRPATCPKIERDATKLTLKSDVSHASKISFASTRAVDKVHKLGHLPAYLRKKEIEKVCDTESSEIEEKPIDPSNASNSTEVIPVIPNLTREDTTTTIKSGMSFNSTTTNSSMSRAKMGMSKSFDPNVKPRFNNSGKHPLMSKDGTQDDFLKEYKLGKVPKYLKNRQRDQKKRPNTPEIRFRNEIENVGDTVLENINELNEEKTSMMEKQRPSTVPCSERTSLESEDATKSCDEKTKIDNSRHEKCFKKEEVKLRVPYVHKLGYKPKFLRSPDNDETQEILKIEEPLPIEEKSETTPDETTFQLVSVKAEITLDMSETFEVPLEISDDQKSETNISAKEDNNDMCAQEFDDNKNNVTAAVVDISPKLGPLQETNNNKKSLKRKSTITTTTTTGRTVDESDANEVDVVKEKYQDALKSLKEVKMERDMVKNQLKFERQRFCGRDKAYKEILERNKDILKQHDIMKSQNYEKELQIQQMKNQLRDTRERNSKVIKEQNATILDLENQLSQSKQNNEEQLKLYEPLKQENDELKYQIVQMTQEFNGIKDTLEQRIKELLDEIETARQSALPIKPETTDEYSSSKDIESTSKNLKLMENTYEQLCMENIRIVEQFEELRLQHMRMCEEMAIKNEQITRLSNQLTKKKHKLNEMMNSCEKSTLLIDRMKTEICLKLDDFRIYYSTLTCKETEIDRLEARCVEALAYDDRLKKWLKRLDDQISELKHHKKRT